MRAKDFVPVTKPRNFVAKNQKTAGAGAHKDKKKAEKQGDVKHKAKQYEEGVAEGSDDIVAVIDGVRSDRMYNDKDHAHNSLSKLVSYSKAKIAELYINGEKVEHFELGKKYIDFEPKQLDSKMAEGWKSKVAGAALAGAAALGGGGAQASEPVTPLAVMATIKMKLPDGSIKTIKKDLGHSYDYRLDDARKDLENVLDRKGIKNYTIHLDRYNAGDADATAPEKTKDYMDKTPSIGKADDNKNYMDKGPYTSKPSKTTYLDKSTGKEFRDMNNY